MLCCAVAGALLAQPSLRITSPADGALVTPGQLVNVTVVASGKFLQVAIIGGDPIGASETLAVPPYEFTIRIPDRIAPGAYLLTAIGFTAPGQPSYSEPIGLQAEEPDDAPIRIKVDSPVLEVSVGNNAEHLTAYGVFPGGQSVVINGSKHTSFTSSATGVATVDYRGFVTPVAPGSAKIIITYRNERVEVPVTVLPKHE